ncbi:hypothetical protein [Nocardioides sp. TF02-7]|nr:hypothetical protein [Nocardioides sp. TF02-7]UMG92167.1 hypothetical protein MF408_19890 [Nocardioides sp. TF02-7]
MAGSDLLVRPRTRPAPRLLEVLRQPRAFLALYAGVLIVVLTAMSLIQNR